MSSRFSDILMDHFTSPRNSGRLELPDRIGIAGKPGHGPFMVLYLHLEGNLIVDAKHETNGCGTTIAAGSMLTEMIMDRTLEQCASITAEQVSEALGGVPSDKMHSPVIAVAALKHALANFEELPE